LDGFGNVVAEDNFEGDEVGDGAGDIEDAVI